MDQRSFIYCYWLITIGLDFQNLAYQGQNLDQFWATDVIFVSKEPHCNGKTTIGLDFKNLVYQTKNLARFVPNLKSLAKEFFISVSETQAQSSSNIISDYKLKIEEYHLSSVRDFSKFYKDIEKLNILAFCERLNLKSQEKIILSVPSYWYGARL